MAQGELWERQVSDVTVCVGVVAAAKMIGMMATIQAIDQALAEGRIEVARRRCHAILVESPDVNEEHLLAQMVKTIGELRSHARETLDVKATELLRKLEEQTKRLT